MSMTDPVREQPKCLEKNSVDTVTGCRNQPAAKARNQPPHFANNPTRSIAVRREVETVHQQRADDGQ